MAGDNDLKVGDFAVIPEAELTFTFARSGGPGGQNVNKVATRAVLRWDFENSPSISDALKDRAREKLSLTNDGAVVLNSSVTRSQLRNKEDCLERLATMLVAAFTVPKVRRKTRVPRGVNQRRLTKKSQRSDIKRGRSSDWHSDS